MRDGALLRFGVVSEVDLAHARVRVLFSADDELASWWLAVLQQRAGHDRAVWLPEVGEAVACLLDAHAEDGVVLGARYTDDVVPPTTVPNVARVQFSDDTAIEYDRAAHKLTVDVRGGDVELRVESGHHVELGGTGGEQLVTKAWLQTVFAAHTHPIPSGLTGPPTPGTALVYPLVSEKVRTR